MRYVVAFVFALLAAPLSALELDAPFQNIDGGSLRISDWAGQPVLVVNTASRCGFTPQYEGLQALYDRYRDAGLVVLAVPSDDFRQELSSDEEVKAFCEMTYGIDMPMTGVTHVKGSKAHPFFASLKKEAGFAPRWNFNKVLIAPDGSVAATYRSRTQPLSGAITKEVEALLAQ
ncbi:glutathione peroxidase [Shimia sp. FJ5]|uniref:glutathione peroxidase n=1 Tax=Shimia sp. FJ5 TaxID=3079054 RepID=UPI002606788E|nr:glutathione peroxidase [Shimia sp. FJ5]MDV4144571.1 glutathione peroxidase [Shimia sp. FJ5]